MTFSGGFSVYHPFSTSPPILIPFNPPSTIIPLAPIYITMFFLSSLGVPMPFTNSIISPQIPNDIHISKDSKLASTVESYCRMFIFLGLDCFTQNGHFQLHPFFIFRFQNISQHLNKILWR